MWDIITVDFKKEKIFGDIENFTNIIEMDESVLGKKQKYGRGRLTKKQWVFGLAERQSRKTLFFVVADRTNATLHGLLKR